MEKHKIVIAVVVTYLLVSFVPQISATALLGRSRMSGAAR